MIINYQFNAVELLEKQDVPHIADAKQYAFESVKTCFSQLIQGSSNAVFVSHANIGRQLHEYIHGNFICVKAAGGVVTNECGEYLLMNRNERTDLPKGKVEPGETLAQAALRETMEETGLSCVRLKRLLTKTYHIYNLYGGWHFKQTSWYEMQSLANEHLCPQTEEGITDVFWTDKDTWLQSLRSSFSTMTLLADIMEGRI